MIKGLVAVSLSILLVAGCRRDPSVFLAGRWNFASIDMPMVDKFLYEIHDDDDDAATTMKKLFLGNKLILRSDSSFDLLLMKQYLHGRWQYHPDTKSLNLLDASAKRLKIEFHVDTVNNSVLHIDTDEFTLQKVVSGHLTNPNAGSLLLHKAYYQFYLDEDPDHYRKLSSDPYSVMNNWWRIKPPAHESDEQIRKRVLNHLAFWQLLFHDADENNRPYISYNWFSSPLVIASNGVIMKLYEDVKTEWDENFFDSMDAHKGYELMRQCFSKKLSYLQTDNKYVRNEDIVKQLTRNFTEAMRPK